jgi:hypothetical protein
MKLLVEFDIEIEGDGLTEKDVMDNFNDWFEPAKWQIAPDEHEDDCLVWIRGWEIKS